MPIKPSQIKLRDRTIGGSDVAALLNLSPFTSKEELRMEKSGLLTPRTETEAMSIGSLLEDSLLNFASNELGPLRRNQRRVHKTLPLACNIDALLNDSGDPVEAKVTGITGPVYGVWGDEGTDQVPEYVIAQCHAHMLVTDTSVCHVPALIGGRGIIMFRVERSAVLSDYIEHAISEFWECHVIQGVPCDGQAPPLDVLKRIRRVPAKVIPVPDSEVVEWLAAKQAWTLAMDKLDAAQATMIAHLGDAEAGVTAEHGAITYYEQTRKGYEVKASTYRVLRHRKDGL